MWAAKRIVVSMVALCLAVPGVAHADGFGPLPPENPGTGANGIATMHGDSASSDSTPFAGPGTGAVDVRRTSLASACPTVLSGADRMPVALCTTMLGRTPTAHLLDPATGKSLAEMALQKGNLLGGVYAYLDHDDRLVTVDGHNDLLRIGHRKTGGHWHLFVADRTPLPMSKVVSLAPDWQGRVWSATADGTVGVTDPKTRQTHTVGLPFGERVDNSISTAPGGTAVATDHALYQLTADANGMPRVAWRHTYDRGPARKPGQLSWGTGASPTYFGPKTGTEYMAITDNAVPREHLQVFRADSGRPVCSVPVFHRGNSGAEDSPIGSGRSVFVSSSYGYPYPATPEGAGESEPRQAPFAGGMQRIDVNEDGSGCRPVWSNNVRSAAVPRLSLADGLVYTVRRTTLPSGRTTPLDGYELVALDSATGAVRGSHRIGGGFFDDTLQMVGTIAQDGTLYQGTVSGIMQVRAQSSSSSSSRAK